MSDARIKTGLSTMQSLLNYDDYPMLWRVTIGTNIDTPNSVRWIFYVVAGDISEAALIAKKIIDGTLQDDLDTILQIADASDGDGLSMIWFDTARIDVAAMKSWIDSHSP